MAVLISGLELLLYIAVVLFIAYVILWVIRDWFGWTVDAKVMKFGQIIVGLICLIAIVVWLGGLIGYGSGLHSFLPR
jgi:hypothetical protein